MNKLKAGWILIFSLVASVVVLAYLSPQRSCFHSGLFQSISVVDSHSEQNFYECRTSQVKAPPSSQRNPESVLLVKRIEKEIDGIEFFLRNLGKQDLSNSSATRQMNNKRLELIVSKDRPLLFQIKEHQLFLGWQLANQSQKLQMAVIRAWLQNSRGFNQGSVVYRQALASIISTLKSGELRLDTKNNWRPQAWHEALLSLSSYCQIKSVTYLDHLEFCDSLDRLEGLDQFEGLREINDLSLAHYLADIWLLSYRRLSLQDQGQVLSGFSDFIEAVVGEDVDGSAMSLNEKLQKMVIQFLVNPYGHSNKLAKAGKKNFLSLIYQHLNDTGYDQNLNTPKIDFLYKTFGEIGSSGAALLEPLQKIANSPGIAAQTTGEQRSLLYGAVVDDEGYWLPPYLKPLPRGIFSEVSAQLIIIKVCGGISGEELMRLAHLSTKILFLKECHASIHPNLTQLFDGASGANGVESGIASFVKANPQFPLVLINSRHLTLFADNVEKVSDLFSVLNSRKSEDPLFASLNWRSLSWDPYKQVYEPESETPLIEMFR